MVKEFDFIVVGGGAAGCVLASRLSENPDRRVLLLEAGGSDRHPLIRWPAGFAKMTKGKASWGWETVPQVHMGGRRLWFTQARIVGGGSSINAQIYCRGNPADYDAWADECSADEWRYASVLPYFLRAEDNESLDAPFHARSGPIGVSNPRSALPVCEAFIEAGEEFGLPRNDDFNGARQLGVGFYQLTQRGGRRSSTATGYLSRSRKRRNLTVRLGAVATKLLFDHGRVTGVEVVGKSGVQTVSSVGGVVLSCGAIGTPRLLMLSGVGPADHLRQTGIVPVCDHPNVGRNLQDHINLSALAECSGPHSYDSVQRLDKLVLAVLKYLAFRTGPVASPLFESGGFAGLPGDSGRPAIQFHLGLGTGIEKGIAKVKGSGITLNSAYLRPRSRGTVTLRSGDPLAAPLIDPNYWAVPEDLANSLEGLRMAREILRQPAFGQFIRREVLPGSSVASGEKLREYANAFGKTDHHPVGTCAMGASADSVVDPSLRVRGLRDLWIERPLDLRRLDNANLAVRQHQRAHDHDRRKGQRPDSRQLANAFSMGFSSGL